MPWIEYFRTRLPWMSAWLNVEACKNYPTLFNAKFSQLVIWEDSQKFCWMVQEEEMEKVFQRLMQTDIARIQEKCREMDIAIQHQRAFTDQFLQRDYTTLTLSQIKSVFQENNALSIPTIGSLFMFIDAFDIFSEKKVKQAVREKLGNDAPEKEIEKWFNQLSVPNYTTYALQEEKEFMQAALTIQHNPKEKEKIIQKIYETYWWGGLGWDRQTLRSTHYFKEKVETLISTHSAEELSQRIAEVELSRSNVIVQRNQFIQENNLQALIPIIQLMDLFAAYHDIRKEGQMKANWVNYQLIDSLSRITGIAPQLLDNATAEEIITLCDGNPISIFTLEQRGQSYYYELTYPKETLYHGAQAQKKIASISIQPLHMNDFSGTIAQKGKVSGKAKVCFGAPEALEKIHAGDILVTGMTTPDFVPAMRKAAAIITDEGGITCHAAIISRELKIPCIVGTKIGTKVLKDNDMIEVNANHGGNKTINMNCYFFRFASNNFWASFASIVAMALP